MSLIKYLIKIINLCFGVRTEIIMNYENLPFGISRCRKTLNKHRNNQWRWSKRTLIQYGKLF